MSSRPTPGTGQQEAPSRSVVRAFVVWCLVSLLAAWAIFELKAPDPVPASAPQSEFSAERAVAHVRAIARVPHPLGSRADGEARDYLVAQLSALGLSPEVVTGIGTYNGSGAVIAGKTNDVVARLPGTASSGAIMLMAHYDSVSTAPGAADDAAGVAAILETLRALKAGSSLKNDLIVLITDGEEQGLLGAEASASSHPWAKDPGLIMNFEARGNHGPSLLFETGKNNGALINGVAKAAPYPIGSSLFYALYKQLPNDTDFSVFRPTGIPGLNFAFGGHLDAYHSRLDTPGNLDLASLQHHGSYALALVRHFGQMELTNLKQTGDNVFFDWLGSMLITYSERWVIMGEGLATIFLILAIVVSVRNRDVRTGNLVLAGFVCLVVLLSIPVAMTAAGWLLLQLLGSRLLLGDTPANSFLLIGLSLLGAAAGCALLGKLRARFNLQELSLAGLVVVCVLSWTIALLLPAGSYLLFWPFLLSVIGLFVRGRTKSTSPLAQMLRGTLPGAIVAILLFAPVAYLFYVFLTLNLLSIAAVGVLLGLFFCIAIPLINVTVPRSPWPAIALPLLVASVCLGIGVVKSHPSSLHPWPDTLLYSLNADDHTAAWISDDRAPDAYTTQFFGGQAPARKPMPDFLAGSQRSVLAGAAPVVDLQPPISEIEADEQNGDIRTLRMNVRSQRDAHRILVRFDPSVKVSSIKIAGRNLTPRPSSTGLVLLLHGMDAQGADLELALKAPSGISYWVSDYSSGLPTTQQRGEDLMAAQGSDETMVVKKYVLGKPAK
ncbi:MAG TPA: M28 family peptidase [Candidatus Angelobacter sp.]|jgi:hypothetical protein|nr:M28 family peptidase [Candidatus Angelobacter sp.]